MNPPGALTILSRLVRGTFRQALASRLLVVTLFGCAVVIALCASIGIEGGQPLSVAGDSELYAPDGQPLAHPGLDNGALTVGFGLVRVPLFRDAQGMVAFIQVLLAKWVAGVAGTMLVLVGTAGFLPEALRPQSASVLLTKPLSRSMLLIGKAFGVLAFVAVLACLFVGGTWLAIGSRTGLWPSGYLLSVPLLLLNFAMIFGVSALLAVWTRSTVVCILGSVVLWLVCTAVNCGRHNLVALPELAPEGEFATAAGPLWTSVEIGYWALPKPADLAAILDTALDADAHFSSSPTLEAVRRRGQFHPPWIFLSGLVFSAATIGLASREFERVDY